MKGSRIVIGFDASPGAEQAMAWGLAEAARRHGEAELVYAWTWPNYLPAAAMVPGAPVWPDMAAEREVDTMLAAAVERAHVCFPGVPVTSVVERGPAAAILRDRSAGATLMVLGGRSHGAVAGFLLGSIAGAVAAHADCTVVVVRGEASSSKPILLGLDKPADRPTEFAFEQAAAREVALNVVRAWLPPDPWIGSRFIDREEIAVAEHVALRDELARWREKYPSVRVHSDTVIGHPYRVIADAAADAGLVVLGARGRGGFSGLRLGSVTRYALHHVNTTIAVVR